MMRKLLPGLVGIAVLGLLLIPAGQSMGEGGERPEKALWVWVWGTPGKLVEDVSTMGFDRVYLYCEGGFTSRVKRTIRELRGGGIAVDALGGEPRWATTDRRGMIAFIRSVRRYQRGAPPRARLSGIHLDVEPHALDSWNRNPQWTRISFLDSLRAASRAAGDIPLAGDLPFWFDGITVRYHGLRRTLSGASLGQLDSATLMAYRDSPAEVIDVSRRELKQGGRLGVPLTIGVETGKSAFDQVTFREEGRSALTAALSRIRTRLAGTGSFAGVAVHSYQSLIELRN